ncbi:hypothetical protein MSAN_00255100 [Mycena sanguinolenta]|uniref:Transmembrane protein n=1 Tax=Mycena sanguinolenta TaxID=230812 RepID=A0A8H7DLV8_9AGAR|nr:hypothetical protein MSAN_00255100 [Mycena sanguinolenta]
MLPRPTAPGFRNQSLPPFPTQADPNHVIPSWVVVMAAATPSPSTFDAAVASAIVTSLAGGSPTTSSTSTATTLPPQTVTVSSSAPPPTSSSQSRSQSSSLILAASSSLSTQSSLSRATNATSTITQIASPSASTIASGATSADAQAALHQNSALAIIVGIFIALFVMVFVVIVLLCLRRRRRRSQIQSPDAYTRSTGRSMSIPFLNITASVPSDTSPVDTAAEKALEAGSPSTLRRSDTGNDSRSTRLSAGPSTSVAAGKILGVFSSRRAVNAGPQSPDSDVINGLTARIRDLEAQVQSMALPDEAPPVYVKEVSGSMRSDQQ